MSPNRQNNILSFYIKPKGQEIVLSFCNVFCSLNQGHAFDTNNIYILKTSRHNNKRVHMHNSQDQLILLVLKRALLKYVSIYLDHIIGIP